MLIKFLVQFILLVYFTSNLAFSQNFGRSKPRSYLEAKNMIGMSVGYLQEGGIDDVNMYISFRLDYNRRLWAKENWLFTTAWLGGGPGYGWQIFEGDPFYYGQFTMLTGKRNHHFEIALDYLYIDQGYTYLYDHPEDKTYIYYSTPGFRVGYLYYSTDRMPLSIRFGVGFPERIYFGSYALF